MRQIFLIPVYLLCVFSCSNENPETKPFDKALPQPVQLITIPELIFDQEYLFKLESYKAPTLNQSFENPYAILVYFSQLSCSSCVAREIGALNKMRDRFERVDFVLIVHGQDEWNLRNMRRIGKVKYPILIEQEHGATGFPNHFTIAFLDKEESKIKFWYHPSPDPTTEIEIKNFETMVATYLKVKDGQTNTP